MVAFLEHSHDMRLVIFAAFICIATTCVAALMLRFLVSQENKYNRNRTLLLAASLIGFGVWATHFVAMLGYSMPGDVQYSLFSTVLSLLIGQGAIWIALKLAFDFNGRIYPYAGGAVAGLGVCLLHYIGISGASYAHMIVWQPLLVGASVIGGIVFTTMAFPLLIGPHNLFRSTMGAVSFVVAVLILHFVGMAAITVADGDYVAPTGMLLSSTELASIVGLTALIMLGVTITAVFIELQNEIRLFHSNREFGVLIQSIQDTAIYLLDPSGNIMTWNKGAARLKGYSAKEAIGMNFSTFFSEEDRRRSWPQIALERARRDGAFNAQGRRYRKDGTWFWADVTIEPVYKEDGSLRGYAKVTRDITERKSFEEQVSELSANLDAALENMRQGLCLFDAKGKLVLSNSRTAEILDLSMDDLTPGRSFRDLVDLVLADFDGEEADYRRARAFDAHDRFMASPDGGAFTIERKDGVFLCISERPRLDGGWVSTFDDVSESHRSAKRIKHLSSHDSLTGLPNRSFFRQLLDQQIEEMRGHEGNVVLAMLNLNRFKDVNDKFGHSVGDELLQMVAQRIRHAIGEGVITTRLSGDEFAVFKRVVSTSDINAFASSLESAITNITLPGGAAGIISGSVGIAVYPQDAENTEVLFSNADLALSRAKKEPLRRCCYYEPEMDEDVRNRRVLQADILNALEDQQFQLLYQVQCCVATGEPIGYEALLRWMHPEYGMVTPDRFIDAAEQNGLIIPLGEWVIRQACRDAASWSKPYKVAVNISPIQLVQMDLPRIITESLLEAGLPASRLEVEITETAIIDDKLRALTNLRRIKALGVSVAIDDFGTGYSSLDTLNSFEFDKIKIDRSFLADCCDNENAQAIIRAVLALGQSLGLPVLAEGVENEQQLALLRAMDCAEAQGYYFGKPGEYREGDEGGNSLQFASS
ncbi:EAL domain-containing protein [Altericroceibacterium spongiae]|uniref:EAL domain-containing protein n=1 Tax=Altericroceibacterium spongiae TaxID=2320269 RepID=A0A420ECE2_9SPHN|nr:EAL domain-containing protein [Altericroceibacterium spongiae]RKF18379.1 EAL domain-containing protein [Altericroceibacterium spongiae]